VLRQRDRFEGYRDESELLALLEADFALLALAHERLVDVECDAFSGLQPPHVQGRLIEKNERVGVQVGRKAHYAFLLLVELLALFLLVRIDLALAFDTLDLLLREARVAYVEEKPVVCQDLVLLLDQRVLL